MTSITFTATCSGTATHARTARRAIGDSKLAVGYLSQTGTFYESPSLDPGLWDNADGGLVTTVEDMTKWAVALQSGKILKKSNLDQIWSKIKLTNGKTEDYGFGVVVNDYRGGKIIGHSGRRPGVTANLTTFVDSAGQMLTVAVLCNVSLTGQPGFDIGFGIVQLLDARWR